jgi:uncharacterized protein (DUF427 family)
LPPPPVRCASSGTGRTIARSKAALELREHTYPPVIYIPREDADMALFERTAHTSHCPYKGDANYFSLHGGDARDNNAVWTYEKPLPEAAALKDHVAFYPNKVEFIRE